jgi:hypothetical protein
MEDSMALMPGQNRNDLIALALVIALVVIALFLVSCDSDHKRTEPGPCPGVSVRGEDGRCHMPDNYTVPDRPPLDDGEVRPDEVKS